MKSTFHKSEADSSSLYSQLLKIFEILLSFLITFGVRKLTYMISLSISNIIFIVTESNKDFRIEIV